MKNLTKGMLMAALITGMFGCASAYAAEDVQEFSLDPMIVTAQRTETKDLDTPASVTVVTSEEIQNSGAKTAYEIIEKQVGFTNNAYGPGGREFGGSSTRTVLRGLDKGTLVLVNGNPINLLNYNSSEGIPVDAIEKIEIVRGAQTTLYGAEAMAGVVNIITKKGGTPKTTITAGVGNFDKKWSLTSVGDKYFVNIQKDYYGKVNETNKKYAKSSYDWRYRNSTKDSAFVSVSPTDKITLNYAHSEGNYYRDSWNRGTSLGGGTAYYYQDKRDNLSLIYDDKEKEFKSSVSYNQREVNPYKFTTKKDFAIHGHGPLTRNDSSDWKLHSIVWDTQKGWDLRGDKDHIVVGLNIEEEQAKDRTNRDKNLPWSVDRFSSAIYASYKHQFADNFAVTVGARGLHVRDEVKDRNVFLPQLQALYKVSEKVSWYANAGRSFEMPAINQYYNKTYKHAPLLDPGFSNIDPQVGWTYETGVKWVNDKSSFKVDLFHMDIDGKFDWDLIDPALPNTSANKKLVNMDNFRNTGVELEYKQQVTDKFGYKLGMMLANPKTKATGKDYYNQEEAKFQMMGGIDYKIGKLTSNLNYLYVGKRQGSYYDMNGSKATVADHHLKARNLLNANFTYKPDNHHSLSLTMNNILGKEDVINKYENWSMPYNWMVNYSFSF